MITRLCLLFFTLCFLFAASNFSLASEEMTGYNVGYHLGQKARKTELDPLTESKLCYPEMKDTASNEAFSNWICELQLSSLHHIEYMNYNISRGWADLSSEQRIAYKALWDEFVRGYHDGCEQSLVN